MELLNTVEKFLNETVSFKDVNNLSFKDNIEQNNNIVEKTCVIPNKRL
jgi:hypothetical protein